MMSMADTRVVPDTETWSIAALAVAWEVVSAAYDFRSMMGSKDERVTELTNAVIKSYNAILKAQAIEKQS
jgi:hypothetical protein